MFFLNFPIREMSAALKSPHRQLASILVLLSVMFLPLNAASAQSERSFFRLPSPSGSFLAGQEAFNALSTREAAQAFLDATDTQWDNSEVIQRAYAALIADGRIADGVVLAKRSLELDPGDNLAILVLGTVALKERRYSSAIKRLDALGLENFVDIAGAIVHAWALVGQDDLNGAFGVLDELGSNGLESFLIFHRALMADFAGGPTAIELAKTAYEADPFIARTVEAYARVLGNAGQMDAALEVLDNFEREGLSQPSVDQVRTQIEAGRLPGKFSSSVSVGASELFHGIGTALARDGASDVAMVFLRLGLYLDPKSDAIKLSVGGLYDRAGRYEEANQLYASIPANSLFKADASVREARNLDDMGNRKQALARLGEIRKASPDNLDAATALGDMLRADQQYARAIEVYTKALEIVGGDHPRDWRFYYVRGIAYERNEEWDLAEADFLRALELNPDQPQVLNYLGYSWVEKGENLDRALTMIEKAVAGSPRDGYIVDSLGWAFYKLGRYDEAVTVLEEAVRLLPNDPEINDHLGDAYWYAGRKREARFQWTIARDVDHLGDVTKRVIPKLENGLSEN
jgi:Flp pilus assembly protein TadD